MSGLYPKLKSGKARLKGDPTPGYKTGSKASMKLNSPYYKPRPAQARSVKVKKRV